MNEGLIPTIAIIFFAVILLMTVVFFIARSIKRFDLVDAAWGWAFIVVAMTSFGLRQLDSEQLVWGPATLVTALVIIWGTRLSWHILKRIASTDREDPRYVDLREKWRGNMDLNVFLRIYLVQAVLVCIISLPVVYLNLFSLSIWQLNWETLSPLGKLAWMAPNVGALIWLAGFCIESIADRQLRHFTSNPKHKGKIMQTGLWRYSRHPNYFGELMQWWGIFIMALSVPFGWITVIGPLVLTYLILFVSGIPLNEKRFIGREGWREYVARTSMLIPLPPRKS